MSPHSVARTKDVTHYLIVTHLGTHLVIHLVTHQVTHLGTHLVMGLVTHMVIHLVRPGWGCGRVDGT